MVHGNINVILDWSRKARFTLSFEDQGMNSQDLAFFLATHNYNAVPLGSRVKVSLDGAVYMLIPNGDRPGLSDIML
jgi:hypothetical protein